MIRPEHATKTLSAANLIQALEKLIDEAIVIQLSAGEAVAEVVITGKEYVYAKYALPATLAKYEKVYKVTDVTKNRKHMYVIEFTPLREE